MIIFVGVYLELYDWYPESSSKLRTYLLSKSREMSLFSWIWWTVISLQRRFIYLLVSERWCILCTSHLPFMHLTDFVWAYFIVQEGNKKIEGARTIKCSALIKTLSMLVQKRDTVRGIIIAHRVLMFMALSNLCPKIYILTNIYASI